MECEEPVDHGGNATAQQELGHGCVKVSRGLRARDRGQGGTRGGAASGPAEAEPPPASQFGGQAHGDVDHTRVQCRALDGIECAEPRSFLRGSKPCVR